MAIANNRTLGALFGLLLLPGAAFAETYTAPTWPIGNPPSGWRPAPFEAGSWFDPARNGSGWAIEKLSPLAGQTAPLYAGTVYTYDSAGKPYWLLMAGTLQYTGWDEYFRTGVSAKFGGVLNDGVNGACPTCAYVAPNVGPSPYGTGEIRFLGAAQADVYVNNGTAQVERIQASEHILLNPVAELLEGEWRLERYFASGSVSINDGAASIYEITVPGWATAITSDGNVMHKPQQGDRWFVSSDLGANYPIVLGADGSIRQYCFVADSQCGNETLASNGGIGVPSRVGFHMKAGAEIWVFALIDRNTLVRTAHVNLRTGAATPTTNLAFRYRRVVPREQQ
ncbi:MAG TPA: hypothetical protein PK027_09140 [Aquimonas sp.]|nr:hypothetical protein [Aquimonas sp.]